MNKAALALFCATLFCATLFCAGCSPKLPGRSHLFSVRPLGENVRLVSTEPQPSGGLASPLTRAAFREITIGQGSGFADGYDSLRIYANGAGYARIPTSRTRARHLPFQLTSQQLDLLIEAINRDQLPRLQASYNAGIFDGAQGFVELVNDRARIRCWLNNYFPPVAHTYAFCNRHVWPALERELAQAKPGRTVASRAEIDRVFANER